MCKPTAWFSLVLIPAAAALLFALPTHSSRPDAKSAAASRTFSFSYQVHVAPTKDASGKLLLWLPLPQQDAYQQIRDLRIDTTVAHSQGQDPEYGNPYALFQPTASQLAAGFDVSVTFVATRLEHKVSLASARTTNGSMNPASDPALQRYLQPDRLVPLNGVIAELAKQHTAGETTDLAKAQSIYDYVVSTMHYDKSGEGWGRGDAVWACTSKRGNCTDFHSLFIGMMRSSNIPARFEIGFPLPESKSEGDIPGYHCWAEFYLQGTGWVPVDASEASKNPAKRDYFFGAHDDNRVFFTSGRDIRLSPLQKGEPLNYFIYPYAELDGKPFSGLQSHFSFRDLAPAGTNASAGAAASR
jgi:transglutaminase-like putative cysteine protease